MSDTERDCPRHPPTNYHCLAADPTGFAFFFYKRRSDGHVELGIDKADDFFLGLVGNSDPFHFHLDG